jgi:ComF family protein
VVRAATVGRAVSGLLFPEVCPVCGVGDGLGADGFCGPCHRRLADNSAHEHCRRCGANVGPYAAKVGQCSSCRGRPWPLSGVARVGALEGPLRDLLLAFKYAGREELDRFIGRRLAEALRQKPWSDEVEALVAVPTCWHRRLLGRPYIATAISREVARATGLVSLPLLRRVKRARSQIGLSYHQRLENVKGAFRLARGVKLDKAVLCLVDDVSTTGATLAECARVLKQGGAARVYAAVACKQHAGASGL